jgi:hypothetical protein
MVTGSCAGSSVGHGPQRWHHHRRPRHADDRTDGRELQPLAQHQGQDLAAAGAQRHAHPDPATGQAGGGAQFLDKRTSPG